MHPSHRSELAALLPGELPYPYFPAREAPWLLVHRMVGPEKIADLRRGPLGGTLGRPGVKDVLSSCGDGVLLPRHLVPLADPLEAFGRERQLLTDRASETAFEIAATEAWLPFNVSFTTWGSMATGRDWRWAQISRKGENLVLQLNFPERFAAELEYLLGPGTRDRLESGLHPVRKDRAITLAWVRLDFDPWGEDVLIEEIQSDWIRVFRWLQKHNFKGMPDWSAQRLRDLVVVALETYSAIWARAAMLAALALSVRELGMRRIWMHQPETGAKLKTIDRVLPPRSLYTDLPRRFGFTPTDRAPEFLYKTRNKVLSSLRRSGQPMFWLLDLSDGTTVQNVIRGRAH